MMRRKFYIPLGMPVFSAHPPAPNEAGDTYYNSTLKKVLTYDGTKWTASSSDVAAGNGLTEQVVGDTRALHVGAGTGIRVEATKVALDTTFTDNRYINTSGDIMTGHLTVLDPPTAYNHASSKKYVDDTVKAVVGKNIQAGAGLGGGGTIDGNPTLFVNTGWGITINSDSVEVNQGQLDTVYSKIHTHNYAPPHDHPYSAVGHTHSPPSIGLTAGYHNFGTLTAGQTVTSPAIAKAANEFIFVQNVHASTYIFYTVTSITSTSFKIEARNGTTGTTHTNVGCYWLRVAQ